MRPLFWKKLTDTELRTRAAVSSSSSRCLWTQLHDEPAPAFDVAEFARLFCKAPAAKLLDKSTAAATAAKSSHAKKSKPVSHQHHHHYQRHHLLISC